MSKLIILSAGVSEDSNNTKLAKKLNKFLDEKAVPNEIYENLYESIPFLPNNSDFNWLTVLRSKLSFSLFRYSSLIFIISDILIDYF